MPNLRSQEITGEGIALVASDGRSFALTRAEVIAHYQSLSGTAASRRTATIQWVKDCIEAALGAEQLRATLLDFDFDTVQGLRGLGVRGE